MHKLSTFEKYVGLVGIVILFLGGLLWNPAPVTGQGPEDRPTLPPPTTPIAPSYSSPAGVQPSLRGTIINWGFRNEPSLSVLVSGADWHLETLSDAAGRYIFEQLGNDVVLLNVKPSEESPLTPLTIDVAVRPIAGDETIVNLGVFEGSEPLPLPATHTMDVSPSKAHPGDRVTFTVHVKNDLETHLTHAQLTDYLPPGLGFVSAESDRGTIDYADNLVVIRLGDVEPGGEATVTIVALVEPDGGPAWELINRSSLVYRESIVTQAKAAVSVSAGQASELPVTGSGLPLAALGLGAILIAIRRLRTQAVKT